MIYPRMRLSKLATAMTLQIVLQPRNVLFFNAKGQRIREWKIENEKLKINTAYWDLRDSNGSRVSSGVYFVRVKVGEEYQV